MDISTTRGERGDGLLDTRLSFVSQSETSATSIFISKQTAASAVELIHELARSNRNRRIRAADQRLTEMAVGCILTSQSSSKASLRAPSSR